MKVIIVEDEYPNALRLQKILADIDANIEVLAILDGLENTMAYMAAHSEIELIFLDLHLTDGNGLDILAKTGTNTPVIFTTAYDQYALDAFKYLSVDYLLKPVKAAELKQSLEKYHHNFKPSSPKDFPVEQLISLLKPQDQPLTFIGRRGKSRYPIQIDQIAYFYAEERETWAKTFKGMDYQILKTLEQLAEALNSQTFFRANRKVICNRASIEKFEVLAKSKIKLGLQPPPGFEVIVSSERSGVFKEWVIA